MLQEGIVLISVLIIVEIIKRSSNGKVNRYLPFIALLLGVVAQVVYEGVNIENMFQGILIGGAAAGVYDFGSKTILDK